MVHKIFFFFFFKKEAIHTAVTSEFKLKRFIDYFNYQILMYHMFHSSSGTCQILLRAPVQYTVGHTQEV